MRRAAFLAHLHESGERNKKTVLKSVKSFSIIAFGDWGVLISLFPCTADGGVKEKMKVTCLIKAVDTFKGQIFFYGSNSITLNPAEMSELLSYATKALDKEGIEYEIQPLSQEDDENDDIFNDMSNEEGSEIEDEVGVRKHKGDKKGKKAKVSGKAGKKGWKARKRRVIYSSSESSTEEELELVTVEKKKRK